MFDLDFSWIHRASVTKPRSTLNRFNTPLVWIALRQLLETPRKQEKNFRLSCIFFFRSVAAWLDAPDTQFLLDFIRPDFLLLRVRWFAALKGNWFSCVFSWELPDFLVITVNNEVRSCIFLVTLLIVLARLPNKCVQNQLWSKVTNNPTVYWWVASCY